MSKTKAERRRDRKAKARKGRRRQPKTEPAVEAALERTGPLSGLPGGPPYISIEEQRRQRTAAFLGAVGQVGPADFDHKRRRIDRALMSRRDR